MIGFVAGPYMAPPWQIGTYQPAWVLDSASGTLVAGPHRVDGFTNAPLVWPWNRSTGTRKRILIDRTLERMIRTEAATTVSHYIGRSPWWVSRARHAFSVERFNEGTLALWSTLTTDRLGRPHKRELRCDHRLEPAVYLTDHDSKTILAALRLGMEQRELAATWGVTEQWIDAMLTEQGQPKDSTTLDNTIAATN